MQTSSVLIKKQVVDNINQLGILQKKVPSGIAIYQDYENEKKGYRISDKLIHCYKSDNAENVFLRRLLALGHSLDDIDLPHGLVYYQNRIIGQIITYYAQNVNLRIACRDFNLNPYTVCLEVYSLIKELYDKGIIYIDIHGGNFLYTPYGVKIIDFDKDSIAFRDDDFITCDIAEDAMLQAFIRTINDLTNQKSRTLIPNLLKAKSLDDIYCELCLGEALTLKKER